MILNFPGLEITSVPYCQLAAMDSRHASAQMYEHCMVRTKMLQGWEETDMVERGAWTVLPDGTCLWRLSILSTGASSHIIVFRCVLTSLPSPSHSSAMPLHMPLMRLRRRGSRLWMSDMPAQPFPSWPSALTSSVPGQLVQRLADVSSCTHTCQVPHTHKRMPCSSSPARHTLVVSRDISTHAAVCPCWIACD